jgi:hypothetical protein
MNHYWFIKVHDVFRAKDENTGELIELLNWRESIVDVYAESLEQAKETALLTGIKDGEHYNDIVEEHQ